jgi:hypothetical protein
VSSLRPLDENKWLEFKEKLIDNSYGSITSIRTLRKQGSLRPPMEESHVSLN